MSDEGVGVGEVSLRWEKYYLAGRVRCVWLGGGEKIRAAGKGSAHINQGQGQS